MIVIVLDSSAIIRLYVPDGPLPEGLSDCIVSAQRGDADVLVPELALAEVAQVIWKKEQMGYINSAEANEIISAMLELPIEVVGHFDLILESLTIARQHKLTIYDSIFLALARKKKATLITANLQLKKVFQGIISMPQ
ncbi:MAG: type II toxin-antitoxin system VapC family toxin [Deltaproteobacteria bacterium]|nr:type II toxin-antitoxin system VapC family toxin [Deltaproteobacteria bacterium]